VIIILHLHTNPILPLVVLIDCLITRSKKSPPQKSRSHQDSMMKLINSSY